MRRGDLSDAEWERLRPFLPVGNRRCSRWRDHRQVIGGILHRVRTGVQWRDLPERFGPWKTVYERHRLWSADGTWERLLQQVRALVHMHRPKRVTLHVPAGEPTPATLSAVLRTHRMCQNLGIPLELAGASTATHRLFAANTT